RPARRAPPPRGTTARACPRGGRCRTAGRGSSTPAAAAARSARGAPPRRTPPGSRRHRPPPARDPHEQAGEPVGVVLPLTGQAAADDLHAQPPQATTVD